MRDVLVQARKPSPISAAEHPVRTRMSEVLPDCTLPRSQTTGANSSARAAISSCATWSADAVGQSADRTTVKPWEIRSRRDGFADFALTAVAFPVGLGSYVTIMPR